LHHSSGSVLGAKLLQDSFEGLEGLVDILHGAVVL
jgi:hypothetical protein